MSRESRIVATGDTTSPATRMAAHFFTARLEIIGINPFVFVPDDILADIFRQAKRDKSPIPVKGTVNQLPYTQTLVKFKGAWRLYINMTMLKNSPRRIGEELSMSIAFNSND